MTLRGKKEIIQDDQLACQRKATAQLLEAGCENALQEGRWMVELAGRGRPWGDECRRLLQEMLSKRLAGIPFQYAVGSVEFYCIEIQVGPGVLIPRPETELLVERALQDLQGFSCGPETEPPLSVLDLCTGSAAIPLAMAAERPDCRYTAIDLSPDALEWAKRNISRLKPPSFTLLQGDLFEPLEDAAQKSFCIVTANPPYISHEDYLALPADVRDHEPQIALETDDDGMMIAKRIMDEAPRFLRRDGVLIMEIGETQGAALRNYADGCRYRKAEILKDLCGRDRFLHAIAPDAP